MIVYFNNIKLDLPDGLKFARTKQVNTIGSLSNRQNDFTLSISLPKTKHNVKALQFLGNQSNVSTSPYVINTGRVYNDAGDCEIYDGYAVVKPTTSTLNIVIYSGYISFVKSIENRVLTDVGLSELNHLKNLESVVNTWENDLPYRYIVADYNGIAQINGEINVDYLIPSVKMSYLWDKIHEYTGYTYEGSVFDTEAFQNLWITYPKTIGDGTQQTELAATGTWNGAVQYFNQSGINQPLQTPTSLTGYFGSPTNNQYVTGSSYTVYYPIGVQKTYSNGGYNINQSGTYKITVSGTVNDLGNNPNWLRFYKYTDTDSEIVLDETIEEGVAFSYVTTLNLIAGDGISVGGGFSSILSSSPGLTTTIELVTGNVVDFENAFINFSIRDFMNEVLWRFSLTPFKDKYENNTRYLTHQEWLQTTDIVDWSADKNKFVETISEAYTLPDYAQRNYLRYKYNDIDATHNDGYLSVNNKNLDDNKTIIQSNLHSPEFEKTVLANREVNVYKFWDKEPQEDNTIKYKELDNRFYIMRANYIDEAFNVTSGFSEESQGVSGFWLESFENLDFTNIVNNYYTPIYSMLNSARIETAQIYLNDTDISNLDFKKLYYIKEQSSYYVLNKIPNYISKGVYNCELIEVDYYDETVFEPIPEPSIFLISNAQEDVSIWNIINEYEFVNYTSAGATIKAQQLTDAFALGGVPTGFELNGTIDVLTNQFNFVFPETITTEAGYYQIQITDVNGLVSNYSYAYIPESDVVTNNPTIDISFFGSQYGYASNLSDIQYRFNEFTPISATIKIKEYDFLSGQTVGGYTYVKTLTELAADTTHQLTAQDIGFVGGWFWVEVITDTITFEGVKIRF